MDVQGLVLTVPQVHSVLLAAVLPVVVPVVGLHLRTTMLGFVIIVIVGEDLQVQGSLAARGILHVLPHLGHVLEKHLQCGDIWGKVQLFVMGFTWR